jgi:hypothetical protein
MLAFLAGGLQGLLGQSLKWINIDQHIRSKDRYSAKVSKLLADSLRARGITRYAEPSPPRQLQMERGGTLENEVWAFFRLSLKSQEKTLLIAA